MNSLPPTKPTRTQYQAAITTFFATQQGPGTPKISKASYDAFASANDLPSTQAIVSAYDGSWSRAVADAGHVASGRRPKSRVIALRDFRGFADEYRENYGKRLTERRYEELRDPAAPSSSLLRAHHGTWSEACARVGLQSGRAPRKRYAEKDIHRALKKAASRASLPRGVAPTVHEYDRHRPDGAPSSATIKREAGRWLAVCQGAKLRPRREQVASSHNKELLA